MGKSTAYGCARSDEGRRESYPTGAPLKSARIPSAHTLKTQVWGLGWKVEGSGFRLQGFRLQAQVQASGFWASFRLGVNQHIIAQDTFLIQKNMT